MNRNRQVIGDRRIEIVANALVVWGGVQVAVDTTFINLVRGDGWGKTKHVYKTRAGGSAGCKSNATTKKCTPVTLLVGWRDCPFF